MQKYLYFLILLFSYNASAINHSNISTKNNKRTVELDEIKSDGERVCIISIEDDGYYKTEFILLFNPYAPPISFGLLLNNINFRNFKKDATLVFHGSNGIEEEKLYSMTAENMAEHDDSRLRLDINLIRKRVSYKDVETVLNYFIDKPIQVNYDDSIYQIPNLKSQKDKKEIDTFKLCMKETFKESHQHIDKEKSTPKSATYNNANDTTDKNVTSDKVMSGDKYIAKDSVFCLSEKSLENQSQMLATGIMKFAPQCFSAAQDIKVVLDDFKMFSGTAKVVGVDNGKEMWTTSESLIEK